MADTKTSYPAPPLRKDRPAPATARRRLAEHAASNLRLDPRLADALGEVCVRAGDARNGLSALVEQSTPYGTLRFLYTLVYAPLLVPSGPNPRQHIAEAPPFTTGHQMELVEFGLGPVGQPFVRLPLMDRSHGEALLRQARQFLIQDGAELEALIRPIGVQVPVTIIGQELVHEDTTPSVFGFTTLDGSTRVAICHKLCGVEAEDVAYHLWTNPRTRGRVLREIAELADRPEDELSEDDFARHRAHIIPARIILGFTPHEGGSWDDLLKALDALVSTEHVGHARDWDEGAQQDEINRVALRQAVEDKVITSRERLYLLGALTPDQCANPPSGLEKDRLPTLPDERAIYIASVIYGPEMLDPISRAYRGMLVGDRPAKKLGNNVRTHVATELTFRTFRPTGTDDAKRRSLRSILERTWGWSEFRNKLEKPSGRTPRDMRDAALDELRRDRNSLGFDRLELAMCAAYWMISGEVLKRETRTKDQRSGTTVIRAMLDSEDGIRQLAQAVVDGRAGMPLRAVKLGGGGGVDRTGAGEELHLTDKLLRERFGSHSDEVPEDPAEQLKVLINQMRDAADGLGDVHVRMADLLRDYGSTLFLEAGVNHEDLNRQAESVSGAAARLGKWAQEIEILHRLRGMMARATLRPIDVMRVPSAEDGEEAFA